MRPNVGSKAHHFHPPLSSLGSLGLTQKLGKPPSSTISLANIVKLALQPVMLSVEAVFTDVLQTQHAMQCWTYQGSLDPK